MSGPLQVASYVLPAGVKSENMHREKEWNQFHQQQQTHRASMGEIPKDPQRRSPKSHKLAYSHQHNTSTPRPRRFVDAAPEFWYPVAISAEPKSSYDQVHSRRNSHAEHGTRLSPQVSPAHPPDENRRISGNFNAPTEVELEREKERRRNHKGVEKLKSKVKGWVRQ